MDVLRVVKTVVPYVAKSIEAIHPDMTGPEKRTLALTLMIDLVPSLLIGTVAGKNIDIVGREIDATVDDLNNIGEFHHNIIPMQS